MPDTTDSYPTLLSPAAVGPADAVSRCTQHSLLTRDYCTVVFGSSGTRRVLSESVDGINDRSVVF